MEKKQGAADTDGGSQGIDQLARSQQVSFVEFADADVELSVTETMPFSGGKSRILPGPWSGRPVAMIGASCVRCKHIPGTQAHVAGSGKQPAIEAVRRHHQ